MSQSKQRQKQKYYLKHIKEVKKFADRANIILTYTHTIYIYKIYINDEFYSYVYGVAIISSHLIATHLIIQLSMRKKERRNKKYNEMRYLCDNIDNRYTRHIYV